MRPVCLGHMGYNIVTFQWFLLVLRSFSIRMFLHQLAIFRSCHYLHVTLYLVLSPHYNENSSHCLLTIRTQKTMILALYVSLLFILSLVWPLQFIGTQALLPCQGISPCGESHPTLTGGAFQELFGHLDLPFTFLISPPTSPPVKPRMLSTQMSDSDTS
jgi:hypothetical protein